MLDEKNERDQEMCLANAMSGTVKWYDTTRGFGFVLCDGFEDDFLLHKNVLSNFGVETVPNGSIVAFKHDSTKKGHKITEVLSVERPDNEDTSDDFYDDVNSIEDNVPARVKWFDEAKGYGFVNCHGRAEDVFIGTAVMRNAGYSELIAGQALSIQVAHTDIGQRVYCIKDWPRARTH
jgi:CspA family cold shock protein